jgi:hypothetical protein
MKKEMSLRKISSTEDRAKAQLHKSILSKRKTLTTWLTKNEMLRVELEMVKQEYDVRVGSLYLKDNQLDLEIIKYRNIKSLMEQGISFEKAVEALQETYYAEQLEMEQEAERMRFEEVIFHKREEITDESLLLDIKKLWKQLITKFHADLVQDPEEKMRRNEIMKQINLAYEEQDIDKLKRIEHDEYVSSPHENSIENLEKMLVNIENDIIHQIHFYHEQRMSEWYSWKKRIAYAKKKSVDVFKDIERKLLDDIVKKYEIVNQLKRETEGVI